MAQLVPVADLGRILPGGTLAVAVADSEIALVNVDGRIYALDDSCMRCHAPLSKGARNGLHVVCPGCGWEYDVSTGAVRSLPDLRVQTFDVTVIGAQLLIAVADGELDQD